MTLKERIGAVHKQGVAVKEKIKALVSQESRLERINRRNRALLEAKEALGSHPFTMYDTTNADSTLPTDHPEAVAGYVGGNWPTYARLVARFPNAKHLSIAVNAGELAECLDVEPGDATPAEVPGWVIRERGRLYKLGRTPWVYANASTMPAVKQALDRAGINRADYHLWVADYDGIAQIPAGFDAKQYESVERGSLDYDASVVRAGLL